MNGNQIASLITTAITVSHRTSPVVSDPAVRNAVRQALIDIGPAAKSFANACSEIRFAWIRSAPGSAAGLAA